MSSLVGRTVVVTRAAEQAAATAALVASFGATPVVVPLIEIVDEPAGMAELAALDPIAVDWVVVASPNGATRLRPIIERWLTSPRIAAVGTATAAALAACDLVADTQSAAGLVAVFPQGTGSVVVVQAVDAEPTLERGLAELGWNVKAICAHRSVPRLPTPEQRTAALNADAVLFASGSAVRAWVDAFGDRTPSVAIAIGEQTAATAERAGLKISATSADHSTYGMLVTLSRYLSAGV